MDYTLFGESHGTAVGVLLTHVPPGIPVDDGFIRAQLLRRMAQGGLTTSRREADEVQLLSGVYQGYTTGDPLAAVLWNRDARSGDYSGLQTTPRPSHGDYAASVRARGYNDPRGGGHTSGRLTAPLTAAGAIALTYLRQRHITVSAAVVDEEALRRRAAEAQQQGDSVGGTIRCTVSGLPAGLGGCDWRETVESELSRHVFAIPGVKAVGFGAGADFAALRGSEANDAFTVSQGTVRTVTNRSGGVNGGVTNGMDVVLDVTFRPTPSIARPQHTVDLATMTDTEITVPGRHDSCIALRATPAVEAAVALAVCRLLPPEGDSLDGLRRELDDVDTELTALFARRQRLAAAIGEKKRELGLSVRDEARERQVLTTRGDLLPERRRQVEELFTLLMALSRQEQHSPVPGAEGESSPPEGREAHP